ncbi:uncharacterized protein TrAtP1_003509 [Trichoderma atroviride]|uniref:uncharacterized protein n=1 Tax=Hypocrea atroviridis TaxID=63577 RepID=UPI003329B308|nr:hypothetical protein TrAtP1_003509 [Trichoderma atroviride]
MSGLDINKLLTNMNPFPSNPKLTPPKFGSRPSKDLLASLVPPIRNNESEDDDLDEPQYLKSRKTKPGTAPTNTCHAAEVNAMRKDIKQTKSDVEKLKAT